MTETKKIDNLTDDYVGGELYSTGEEKIKQQWTFGWDLESITGYTEQISLPGGLTRDGCKGVNLQFIRDRSVPICEKLATLEERYNNNILKPSEIMIVGSLPERPVKNKTGLGFFIFMIVIFSILLLIGIINASKGFIIAGVIAGILGLLCLKGYITDIKKYKTKYKVYEGLCEAYAKKYAEFTEKKAIFESGKDTILREAQSLGEDTLRQSALKRSLYTWENRPNKPNKPIRW
jgi:hypothetical protein